MLKRRQPPLSEPDMEAASVFSQALSAGAHPGPRVMGSRPKEGAVAEERRLRADAQRNRDEILRVAIEQFAVHGISASLEDIARVSGVGPGTLYRHFPTREALIAAVLEERRSELLSR